jgi:RNA polymerase sigma-70 factor (ECF subfamily)
VSNLSAGVLSWLLTAGKAAWPGVEVDPRRFAEHLGARLPEGGDPDALHAADLYLACAVELGDPRALSAFASRYLAEIPLYLAGVEHEAAAVAEVRQMVAERLLVAPPGGRPRIAEYSGRGSLASWLRVATLRVASNRRRGERAHADLDAVPEADLLPRVDPELAIVRARYRPAFDEALRAAFAGLAPRERTLLRMHYLDGLSLDRIASLYDVHRATVARWLAAARDGLFERTAAHLGERLRLPAAELESLLAVIRSGLDLSLGSLLAEHAPSA